MLPPVASDLSRETPGAPLDATPDLVCLSHLRWDFVYQRPQHLMSRFAADRRVFFFEEPVWDERGAIRLDVSERPGGVRVAVPHLPPGLPPEAVEAAQAELLRGLLDDHGIASYVLWYYTPMAIGFTAGLEPAAVVYDCMDELSLFRGAPRELVDRESRLLTQADLVFTGGQSLYEAKREKHGSVHAFPSSIDAQHFGRARSAAPHPPAPSPIPSPRPGEGEKNQDLPLGREEAPLSRGMGGDGRGDGGEGPADQAALPRPRLGYFGVIDERIDLDLLAGIAQARPDWQIVMLGPVVKIDPATLPRRPNLHYLGMKAYDELPAYLAGWDVALMPFARNESTRFISPTKTPEYLAGGRPVVSTSIRDVVRPYGDHGLVEIADDPAAFVAAVERSLLLTQETPRREAWLRRVDEHLAGGSWSRTWQEMAALLDQAVRRRLNED
jgi:UDP-galactopyranose mutase